MPKTTLHTLIELKKQKRPITLLTCYDYATAVLLQRAGIDCLLVGDSLAQVVLGHNNTLPVSLDTMITLTAAVRRGAPEVFLIGDLPFLAGVEGSEKTIANAGRLLSETGCDIIKIEVDHGHLDLVARMASLGIPVMAHLGNKPQSALLGQPIVETRSVEKACRLVETCRDMCEAGARAILLECVTETVARTVTEESDVPVISCGSGPHCDGQVLVLHDILSLPGSAPHRISKTYANISESILTAVRQYCDDIIHHRFPEKKNCYNISDENELQFQAWLNKPDKS